MSTTVSLISHGHGREVLVLLKELGELPGAGSGSTLRRVLLTLNRPEPALADALRQHAFPFELILTENPSPLGFGANHNRAFTRDASLGASEAFVVLNPDLHLRGNPLAGMQQVLLQDASAGAVYPRQVDTTGTPSDSERLLPTPRRLLARYLGAHEEEAVAGVQPDWVNAACLLLRREAYEQIGGFDERYYMYCEDVDLCLRLQLAGWRLRRADEAVVEHAAQRASHRNPRHLAWHLASLWRLWHSAVYREWLNS